MGKSNKEFDPYIGLQPFPYYTLIKKVGEGKIGSVYKAVRSQPQDILACKVIPEGKLKEGWDRELEKVIHLRSVPNVVQYHAHGTGLDKCNRPFVWIQWDFIQGINLKDYLSNFPWPLDLAFIENIADTILNVLFACRAVGITHGDLHEGNILISEPDKRILGSPRRIWISDFGYGGSHNELEPKDDFRQFFSIIKSLIKKLIFSNLNPRDRVMLQKIDDFLAKKVLEMDPTQGKFVGDPEILLNDFKSLAHIAERESAAGTEGDESIGPGDYLVAEALGYRKKEWKKLFVPEFLAAQDLLSKNITVLTGARGCGKTMSFRRLTALFDKMIGETVDIKGADQFIGFYINCRELVEAFPWLPRPLKKGMQQQIIHYFHLSWFVEICKTLALYNNENSQSHEWLDGLMVGTFTTVYTKLPQGADILAHVRAFLENEKERCRLTDLGSKIGLSCWPLARMDFLDIIQTLLQSHVSWIGQKPLYLFLDDYTIPIITRGVQQILNPIIFKRRSMIFFKISTESTNSFEMSGLRGKPLELHQDFELIDLATESLHQNMRVKKIFLQKIFKPRIERHQYLKGKELNLTKVLGKMYLSNNEMAKQMRNKSTKGGIKRITYHGENVFTGMWSSDTRTMIQMFTDMLRDANGDLKVDKLPIKKEIQDKIYRSTGGEFLEFIGSVVDPSLWETGPFSTGKGERYGAHLRNIVEAFVNISRHELIKGNLVSNQGRLNPKQAFRIEIIDKFELTDIATKYFEGLIRWHIFLQDWRGKSVRGMITPRMYLNRVLIPISNLTFSTHDNLHLTNEEFITLITKPTEFYNYWKQKRKKRKKSDESGPFLDLDFDKE